MNTKQHKWPTYTWQLLLILPGEAVLVYGNSQVTSVRRYVLEQDPGISITAGYATGGLREQGLHILVISLFIGHFC